MERRAFPHLTKNLFNLPYHETETLVALKNPPSLFRKLHNATPFVEGGRSASFFFLSLFIFLFSARAEAQSLTVTLPSGVDTTGLSASEILSLEHAVSASLTLSGSGSDTLVVELGPEAGSYDLFRREFPLSQTGTFADGCSLDNSSGLIVGLGKFTGLSEFHVRAYLKSAGVGSAITINN